MGIMPPDRNDKWNRVIRRFGLSGNKAEGDRTPLEQNRERPSNGRTSADADRREKPQQKRDR